MKTKQLLLAIHIVATTQHHEVLARITRTNTGPGLLNSRRHTAVDRRGICQAGSATGRCYTYSQKVASSSKQNLQPGAVRKRFFCRHTESELLLPATKEELLGLNNTQQEGRLQKENHQHPRAHRAMRIVRRGPAFRRFQKPYAPESRFPACRILKFCRSISSNSSANIDRF